MGYTKGTALWLLLLVQSSYESSGNVTPLFTFDKLDFEFPSDSVKQAAVDSDLYILGNSNPFAIEVWNTKLFITVPRWLKGSGPTFNYINIGMCKK